LAAGAGSDSVAAPASAVATTLAALLLRSSFAIGSELDSLASGGSGVVVLAPAVLRGCFTSSAAASAVAAMLASAFAIGVAVLLV
jgi:hypothetical protein